MADESFFEEAREQSVVKGAILGQYFDAWTNVMLRNLQKYGGDRIAYIDLFAGPGRYEDGTESTPLIVLRQAITKPGLRDSLVTIFNDIDPSSCDKLRTEIGALKGIETLRFQPNVQNGEVDEELVEYLKSIELVPSLFFIDPWGYKGLSLTLIHRASRDWGCDCVFFFNYNRINMGVSNDAVEQRIDDLFGRELAQELRSELEGLTPEDREAAVLEKLCRAVGQSNDGRPRYVLPFRFKNDAGTRTKHHLIFVSKHQLGYGIMKDIMSRQSSRAAQGVASFEYCPADRNFPTLFELARPLDDLQDMLLVEFAGDTLSVKEIFGRHNVGTPFIMSNYKSALLALETEGRVEVQSLQGTRRAGTMAEHLQVTFPA